MNAVRDLQKTFWKQHNFHTSKFPLMFHMQHVRQIVRLFTTGNDVQKRVAVSLRQSLSKWLSRVSHKIMSTNFGGTKI